MIKVKELIKELEPFDKEAEVIFKDVDGEIIEFAFPLYIKDNQVIFDEYLPKSEERA